MPAHSPSSPGPTCSVAQAKPTARPEFVDLGSHALQQTLRRLDLAFAAFFRRVKAGQTPGFPRFKSAKRFSGFAYPDLAGWRLMQHGGSGATLRLGIDALDTQNTPGTGVAARPKPLPISIAGIVPLFASPWACSYPRANHSIHGQKPSSLSWH